MRKICNSARVINGIIHNGDKVIFVPQGHGAKAFYGKVLQIYRIDARCTWVSIDSNIGFLNYPASLLHKGLY